MYDTYKKDTKRTLWDKVKVFWDKWEVFFLIIIFFTAIWVLMYSAFLVAIQSDVQANALTEERIAHYELHKAELDCLRYLHEE